MHYNPVLTTNGTMGNSVEQETRQLEEGAEAKEEGLLVMERKGLKRFQDRIKGRKRVDVLTSLKNFVFSSCECFHTSASSMKLKVAYRVKYIVCIRTLCMGLSLQFKRSYGRYQRITPCHGFHL